MQFGKAHYTGSGAAAERGSRGGERTQIVLAPGQFIMRIEGCSSSGCITQLKFKTNKGIIRQTATLHGVVDSPLRTLGAIFGPYGTTRGDDGCLPFVWNAADGAPANLADRMGLLYFSGHAELVPNSVIWVELTVCEQWLHPTTSGNFRSLSW